MGRGDSRGAGYPFCPPWKNAGGASFDASPVYYPLDPSRAPAYLYIGRGSKEDTDSVTIDAPGDHKFYIVSADHPSTEYYYYTCSAGFYPSPALSNNGGTYYDVAATASRNGMLYGFLVK